MRGNALPPKADKLHAQAISSILVGGSSHKNMEDFRPDIARLKSKLLHLQDYL